MAIQHLQSSTANKRPTPGAMSDGQLAVNTAAASPGLFFKDASGGLVKVGPVHVGTTAPNASPAAGGATGNTVGEQWLDTTGGTYVFKVWDGSAWRSETGTFVDVNGDTMTGALGIIAGSAASPGLFVSGDTNTGIYSPGADQVAISTNGTGRLFVDSSGNVGIGTAAPAGLLHVSGASGLEQFRVLSPGTGSGSSVFGITPYDNGVVYCLVRGSGATAGAFGTQTNIPTTFFTNNTERLRITSDGKVGIGTSSPQTLLGLASPSSISWGTSNYPYINGDASSNFIAFGTQATERARIDSSGRLLVGTSSGQGNSLLQIKGDSAGSTGVGSIFLQRGLSIAAISGSGAVDLAKIEFGNQDGAIGAVIQANADATWGTNDYPSRLAFSTTADGASSPTERMRITSAGLLQFATTAVTGGRINLSGYADGGYVGFAMRPDSNNSTPFSFQNAAGTQVGSISCTSSATAYNTSSDYRLKENVVPLTGAADRLNQLQVHRFNFIADPDKTVDGFIAHEAQAVVPECVTGSKDEVDADGNPVYQGIDQSKLVPLLTAALQEALAEIESLKARVTALEP